MKKNLFLMLGLGALLLTSCDQDITNEIYLPGGGGSVVVTDSTSTKQLQVFTNLEMLQPAYNTRAVDGQWETNDSIGISSTGLIENLKYVRVGTTNRFPLGGSRTPAPTPSTLTIRTTQSLPATSSPSQFPTRPLRLHRRKTTFCLPRALHRDQVTRCI